MACATGAAALAKCLRDSKTLTHLDLGENSLGDEGAAAIAGILHPDSPLAYLDLCSNRIGTPGVEALAEGIKTTTALKHLGLAWNQLCHAGLRPLSSVGFGALEVLDLRGNVMDERATRVLAVGIVASDTITKIDVRENPYSREATAILGKAIRDQKRRYNKAARKAKYMAKKAKRTYEPGKELPSVEYYWVEQHELRPIPGSSKAMTIISNACSVM